MKIYKIELADPIKPGQFVPEVFATLHRSIGDEYITVTIRWADGNEKTHSVRADRSDDVLSIAVLLQETLDGHKGTGSMINDYYRVLEDFAY